MKITERDSHPSTKNRLTILYDSNCILCSKAVQFITKSQKSESLQFLSLGNHLSKNLLSSYSIPHDIDSIVVVEGAHAYTKSEAIAKILKQLRWWFWPLRITLLLLPTFIADRAYDIVARNRHLIWQEKSCSVETKNI